MHQTGLAVSEASDLRRQMRAAGASYRVTKNSLARLALADTPFSGLDGLFEGPTAIAYSADPVTAAKVTVDYAKASGKLVVLGGGMPDSVLDVSGVTRLAKLPSLDELRARLVGLLQAPASQLAAVLRAPAGQLARVVSTQAETGEAVPSS